MTIHIPVMLREVIEIFSQHLIDSPQTLIVDATLGAGGHTEAILKSFPVSRIIAIDQDEMARNAAQERLSCYGDRLRVIAENFSNIGSLSEEADWELAKGVLFDLGVSNMQLTTPERGFSYHDEGPLDMRMNCEGDFEPASSLLSKCDVKELTDIFREFGEERHAFQIARSIVRSRENGKLPETTKELTELIRSTLPAPVQRKMGTHPARRVFQALRIVVNRELEVLKDGLEGAYRICGDSAVIIVISYHSLEDRIVKRYFIKWAQDGHGIILTKRPLIPADDEIDANRSARSAKLRAFLVRKPEVLNV